MGLMDAILIIVLLIGALDGARKGVVKSLVGLVGSIIVIFLSWILKGSLANVLIGLLPQIGNNASVSVLLYHVISFVLLLIVFSIIYRVILKVTDVIEKIFDATIVLGFVSRILGAVVGFIETYIILFFVLFILSVFNIPILSNSKVNNFILDKTPVITPVIKDTWEGAKEIYSSSNFEESIRILFEKNIINEDNMNKILKKGEK